MAENGKTGGDAADKLIGLGLALHSKKAAIVTHDNPDPDCIAAAFGLKLLLNRHFNVSAAVFHGGLVGRAENRCMVSQLDMDMRDISELDLRVYRTVAMVDTQPGAGNNSLPPAIIPDIVIDHHFPLRKKTRSAPFHDVRREAGSSSTIITEYLMEAGVKIPRKTATALLYGIRTDTYDLEREAGPEDVRAYRFLLDKTDRTLLSRIENPVHNRSYYIQLHGALESTEIYEDALITALHNVEYPEITAEIAEWFFFLRGIRWALAIGVENDSAIYLSLRARQKKRRAGTLIRKVTGRRGTAGGHEQVAGGKIILDTPGREAAEAEIARMKKRFLRALGKDDGIPPAYLFPDKHRLSRERPPATEQPPQPGDSNNSGKSA